MCGPFERCDKILYPDIYDLVGLSIPVMLIVVLLYHVNLVKSCQNQSVSLCIVEGNCKRVFLSLMGSLVVVSVEMGIGVI